MRSTSLSMVLGMPTTDTAMFWCRGTADHKARYRAGAGTTKQEGMAPERVGPHHNQLLTASSAASAIFNAPRWVPSPPMMYSCAGKSVSSQPIHHA